MQMQLQKQNQANSRVNYFGSVLCSCHAPDAEAFQSNLQLKDWPPAMHVHLARGMFRRKEMWSFPLSAAAALFPQALPSLPLHLSNDRN